MLKRNMLDVHILQLDLEQRIVPSNYETGGIKALAGFLYQIVGMLSYGESHIDEEPDSLGKSIDAFLMLEDVGPRFQAEHEKFGQDAVFINTEDEIVLVQFKYSTSGRKIHAPELEDILKKLDGSAIDLQKKGGNVTGCVLATNRELGQVATELWQNEESKDRNYKIRFSWNDMEGYLKRLEDFGKCLGAIGNEIDVGINRLIGKIVRETGNDPFRFAISLRDLNEAFTTEPEARQITEEKIREKVEESLERFMMNEVAAQTGFKRRWAVINKIEKLCSQNALVVLHGAGGCGKTVSLWHWAQQTNFVGIKTTTTVNDYPMADELCNWAELSQLHPWRNENEEKSLGRFQSANPNHPDPLFHLALDGVDEQIGNVSRKEIIRIIDWFSTEHFNANTEGRPPTAVLVITCRDLEDFSAEWYGGKLGQGLIFPPAEVTIGNFTDEELRNLTEDDSKIKLSEEVKSIIREKLGSEIAFESEFSVLGGATQTKYGRFGRTGQIIGYIQHPIIFGSFLLLDDINQKGVLLSDEVSLIELAKKVVSRFIEKVNRRNRLPEKDRRDIRHALRLEAQKNGPSTDRDTWFSLGEWKEPLIEYGFFDDRSAGRLYKETESGGLIHLDSRERWQWTYSWIHKYLISDD